VNKKEAILAMLEGKRVGHKRIPAWDYLYFSDRFYDSEEITIDVNYIEENDWEIDQEPKQKKLVELKLWKNVEGEYALSEILDIRHWDEIPYAIKDGKIFIEVEE